MGVRRSGAEGCGVRERAGIGVEWVRGGGAQGVRGTTGA